MTTTINGRTPEEIKKGLEACGSDECHGHHTDCPYEGDLFCFMHICGDARAYIRKLEEQVTKWISVEERLPESEVPVLLLYKSGYRVIGYWYDDFAEWDDMSDAQISHPDFWMPLPEPPETE